MRQAITLGSLVGLAVGLALLSIFRFYGDGDRPAYVDPFSGEQLALERGHAPGTYDRVVAYPELGVAATLGDQVLLVYVTKVCVWFHHNGADRDCWELREVTRMRDCAFDGDHSECAGYVEAVRQREANWATSIATDDLTVIQFSIDDSNTIDISTDVIESDTTTFDSGSDVADWLSGELDASSITAQP